MEGTAARRAGGDLTGSSQRTELVFRPKRSECDRNLQSSEETDPLLTKLGDVGRDVERFLQEEISAHPLQKSWEKLVEHVLFTHGCGEVSLTAASSSSS